MTSLFCQLWLYHSNFHRVVWEESDSYDMMVAIYISNRLHVDLSTIKQEEI